MNVVDIPIDEITIPEGRRKVDRIEDLAEAISSEGLLHPITVDTKHRLIAGRRRLEACKMLGRETISASIVDVEGDAAALIEIDENLKRQDLKGLDLSDALSLRKEIWERMYPETKHGGAAAAKGSAKGGKAPAGKVDPGSTLPSSRSFVKDTAAKMGCHPGTVNHVIAIKNKLSPEARAIVEGTPIAKQTRTLEELVMADPEHQPDLARKLVAGEISGEAIGRNRRERNKAKTNLDVGDKEKISEAPPTEGILERQRREMAEARAAANKTNGLQDQALRDWKEGNEQPSAEWPREMILKAAGEGLFQSYNQEDLVIVLHAAFLTLLPENRKRLLDLQMKETEGENY
jgi:ParB family chromosome partitioning protein